MISKSCPNEACMQSIDTPAMVAGAPTNEYVVFGRCSAFGLGSTPNERSTGVVNVCCWPVLRIQESGSAMEEINQADNVIPFGCGCHPLGATSPLCSIDFSVGIHLHSRRSA